MGMNDTPSGERIHIGIFGRRNAGKSSLINAITGQPLSVVSDVSGTTTDPVSKAMELLPLGPVLLTDTPGLDDEGDLGKLRMETTKRVLSTTDIALLVVDASSGITESDLQIADLIRSFPIPFLVVMNKSDLLLEDDAKNGPEALPGYLRENLIYVSASSGYGIPELKEKLASFEDPSHNSLPIVSDLISPGDVVVLVIPIDKAAPKGRLILPQQQTIRELLDVGAIPVMCRDSELSEVFDRIGHLPVLVITDSQAFAKVAAIVPQNVPLTSFSILMARHKGNLSPAVHGARSIDRLKGPCRVLISEGCSHHRQCGDIGTQKLPNLLKNYAPEASFSFTFTSGREFPDSLSEYDLIIHCGGCMLNEKEMLRRYDLAKEAGVMITNYGTAISHMNGILDRCIQMIPELRKE